MEPDLTTIQMTLYNYDTSTILFYPLIIFKNQLEIMQTNSIHCTIFWWLFNSITLVFVNVHE